MINTTNLCWSRVLVSFCLATLKSDIFTFSKTDLGWPGIFMVTDISQQYPGVIMAKGIS